MCECLWREGRAGLFMIPKKDKMKKTKTSSFGVSKRESHDSSLFYKRSLYREASDSAPGFKVPMSDGLGPGPWVDAVYQGTSENMYQVSDNSVALAFTSPPYNVGKDYDEDMSLEQYLQLIRNVGKEVYRVLRPGGRYVVNVANLGRKPYIPLHSFFYQVHAEVGFLSMGEIIWQKAKGANGNCAWGSWMSAKAPRLRDIHEYLLVFAKQSYSRLDDGASDIQRNEFLSSTLSIWEIPAESAKRVGHPAPFPIELAARVIRLFSYAEDVVLDPFLGSGTTCVASIENGRHYVGYEISDEYCELSRRRIESAKVKASHQQGKLLEAEDAQLKDGSD